MSSKELDRVRSDIANLRADFKGLTLKVDEILGAVRFLANPPSPYHGYPPMGGAVGTGFTGPSGEATMQSAGRPDAAAARQAEVSSAGRAGTGTGTTRRTAFRKARKALRENLPEGDKDPSQQFRKAAQTARTLATHWERDLSEVLGVTLQDKLATVRDCPEPNIPTEVHTS